MAGLQAPRPQAACSPPGARGSVQALASLMHREQMSGAGEALLRFLSCNFSSFEISRFLSLCKMGILALLFKFMYRYIYIYKIHTIINMRIYL